MSSFIYSSKFLYSIARTWIFKNSRCATYCVRNKQVQQIIPTLFHEKSKLICKRQTRSTVLLQRKTNIGVFPPKHAPYCHSNMAARRLFTTSVKIMALFVCSTFISTVFTTRSYNNNITAEKHELESCFIYHWNLEARFSILIFTDTRFEFFRYWLPCKLRIT